MRAGDRAGAWRQTIWELGVKFRRVASTSSRQTYHHSFLLKRVYVSVCMRVCAHVCACLDRSLDCFCPSWSVRLPRSNHCAPTSGHKTQCAGGAHRQELSQHVAPHLPGTLTVRKSRVGLLAPENREGNATSRQTQDGQQDNMLEAQRYNFCVSAQHETKHEHPYTREDTIVRVLCMGVSTRVCMYDRVPRGRA